MKRTLSITLFSCILYVLTAQKNAIYINPAAIFSIYHPNVEVGYAHEFENGFCSDFGIGVILPLGGEWSLSGDKSDIVGRRKGRGMLLHFEPKYFFISNVEGQQQFLSLKVNLFAHDYESKRFFDLPLAPIVTYNVKSKGFTTNLLYGVRYHHYDNSFMEMSVGMGVRGVNIDNDATMPIAKMSISYRLGQSIQPEEKGNYLRFTMGFNFKVGLAF